MDLQVGHAEIDRQHAEISALVMKVREMMQRGPSESELAAQYTRILAGFEAHFAFEEELMILHDYPHKERHKEQHDRHLKEGMALLDGLQEAAQPDVNRMYDWWRGWYVMHVVREDQDLGMFLRAML